MDRSGEVGRMKNLLDSMQLKNSCPIHQGQHQSHLTISSDRSKTKAIVATMKHHHLLASSFCLILASTVTGGLGFTGGSRSSPSSLSSPSVQARTAVTALQSSSAAANDYYNPNHSSPSVLELASQCATSDSCSVDSAYSYLREIFHAQSGCIAMTGNPNVDSAMCVDVDVVAEVVANLRNKIS